MSSTRSIVAIYPGSFDPITRGHEDVARRTLRFADELLVAVAHTATQVKESLFTVEERVALIDEVFAGEDRIVGTSFTGLLTDFAKDAFNDLQQFTAFHEEVEGLECDYDGIRRLGQISLQLHKDLVERSNERLFTVGERTILDGLPYVAASVRQQLVLRQQSDGQRYFRPEHLQRHH